MTWLKNNWWILVIAFNLGGIYFGYKDLKVDFQELKEIVITKDDYYTQRKFDSLQLLYDKERMSNLERKNFITNSDTTNLLPATKK
jgi:hypothetical protein